MLLGQRRLIARELAEGQLVTLAEPALPLSKPYYVVLPAAHAGKTRRSGVSQLAAGAGSARGITAVDAVKRASGETAVVREQESHRFRHLFPRRHSPQRVRSGHLRPR